MTRKNLFILLMFLFLSWSYGLSQTTLFFSGIEWNIRSGVGGPGPNRWSNDPASVWVDTSGYLHMKVRKIDGLWYCSEIYAQKSYGYGEYSFEVLSDVEKLDPNLVVGLFTYETDNREIDIEFSRWSEPMNQAGWYTIQPPPYNQWNQVNFSLALNGSSSTHLFEWRADSIYFKSTKPFALILPPGDSLIFSWTYKGNAIPPAGDERLHINFWLFQGQAPSDLKEAELILKAVQVPKVPGGLDLKQAESFTIGPNPASVSTLMKFNDMQGEKVIRVYDCKGILCKSLTTYEDVFSLAVSELENGIYLLVVTNRELIATKRCLILK